MVVTTVALPVITPDGLVVSALNATAITLKGRNVIDVRFNFPAVVLSYVVRLCAIVSVIPFVLDVHHQKIRRSKQIRVDREDKRKDEANRMIYVTRAFISTIIPSFLIFVSLSFIFFILYHFYYILRILS